MNGTKLVKNAKNLSLIAVISFSVSAVLCAFIITVTSANKINIERLKIEQLIQEKSAKINEIMAKSLYKTQSLLVIVQGNNLDAFDLLAPSLMDDPSILNIHLAPDGIISNVYPMADNEYFIGRNLFGGNPGSKESVQARDSGELVLSGPLALSNGIQFLAGRLPVYTENGGAGRKFWGIVSIVLKHPQVFYDADLGILTALGYSYELWRINPDTNERQVIVSDYKHGNITTRYIEKPVHILNAEWNFKVAPFQPWYAYPENIVYILVSIFICFFIFFILQNNFDLKLMHTSLEQMAITDPLTGIYNRRHFMEVVQIDIAKSQRLKKNAYILIFDIDKFKKINDTYGHTVGDMVLIELTMRIKANIRTYDLFARYGGEEFIIYTSDISSVTVYEMAERLRLSLFDKKFEVDNLNLTVSASFGVAHVRDYDLKNGIRRADEALYTAKKNGRNCVFFNSKG
ncbi:MAG: sensor domain-containing diguanylate cyclase [Treponema sp.]|jgi:diguanylate cyclase (GGDEF)-like protein|nr:sensor domain-containing diguanylate cyclase [Treponema sp.]